MYYFIEGIKPYIYYVKLHWQSCTKLPKEVYYFFLYGDFMVGINFTRTVDYFMYSINLEHL